MYVCFSRMGTQTDPQVSVTNLYFVPKAVVLGDAKSVYTDGILGEDPVLHHMITIEQRGEEDKLDHLTIS